MEGKSLIADGLALIAGALEDPKLILGHNALNPLLSPHAQDSDQVFRWLEEHVVNNPYFDQERVTALVSAAAEFYKVAREPVEGLADDEIISLAAAFAHPGIQAKRVRLDEIFKEIGPVVRATQAAIRAVQNN